MYYNIEENKKINNNREFRGLFPNIVFPKILTDEMMEEYGYKKVVTNEITPSQFANIVNGEIEVIEGIPTIQQKLIYKSLDECKEIAREKAKAIREETIIAPINNVQVATLQDRENIQGSIEHFEMLSQGKGTIVWTMVDNTEQELTLDELQGALDAYVIRKAQVFAEYQSKKQAIENCITAEELEALAI